MKKYIDTVKDKITVDDLDESQQDIASVLGIDKYLKLCEEFGGTAVFIPKIKSIIKKYTYKQVIELKDIMSRDQIARMLDLSKSTVYKVIKEYEDKN